MGIYREARLRAAHSALGARHPYLTIVGPLRVTVGLLTLGLLTLGGWTVHTHGWVSGSTDWVTAGWVTVGVLAVGVLGQVVRWWLGY